jgi:hypothetical protein
MIKYLSGFSSFLVSRLLHGYLFSACFPPDLSKATEMIGPLPTWGAWLVRPGAAGFQGACHYDL